MDDTLEQLHAEYIDWYRGMVDESGRLPRSASGVDSNGRQFILIIEGLPLNSRKHLPFLCAVLSEEKCECYAYASLLAGMGDDGEVSEELQIVTASGQRSIESTFPINRPTEETVELFPEKTRHSDDPGGFLMHAFVAKPWEMDESERQEYLELWGDIRGKVQWRQRQLPLKQLLRRDFDADLPISGGFGGSKEDAIVVHKAVPNDYVSVERTVLECLGVGRNIEWKLLGQSLIDFKGKQLDKIEMETRQVTDTKIVTQNESFYFDVTECI